MIGLAAGTRIWIVAGVTDLRRGFVGLSGMVQTTLEADPFSGQVFVFRGRRGDLIKVLWWDGDGLCLFAKRLERGRFIWPQATSGVVSSTKAAARVTPPRCFFKRQYRRIQYFFTEYLATRCQDFLSRLFSVRQRVTRPDRDGGAAGKNPGPRCPARPHLAAI
jgi:transposase